MASEPELQAKLLLNRGKIGVQIDEIPDTRNPEIRQFDEIEVIFLQSTEKSLGCQIAIHNFRLIPSS